MPDRTINFGESETEATYQIQDTDGAAGGGNFVVAKDTNANTVLLEYNPASDTWEYAGDVDMNGGNVSGVGTLTADSVNTGALTIGNNPVSRHETLLETISPRTDTDSITFSGIGGYEKVRINIAGQVADSANLHMRFNGVSSTDYVFFDEKGARQTDEAKINLIESAGLGRVIGDVVVGVARPSRIGFDNQLGAARDITGYADKGGLESIEESIDSIEFLNVNGNNVITGDNATFRLFGVVN